MIIVKLINFYYRLLLSCATNQKSYLHKKIYLKTNERLVE